MDPLEIRLYEPEGEIMRLINRRCARIFTGSSAAVAALVLVSGCGNRTSVVLEEKMHAIAVVETNTMTLQEWADAGGQFSFCVLNEECQ